jgi:hypothetical protein
VPALEAWLLYNKEPKDPHITESRFERERADGKSLKPVRMQLKIRLYGMTDPPLITERAIMMREANRLATDLKALEMAFPKGFGRFAQQVRAC